MPEVLSLNRESVSTGDGNTTAGECWSFYALGTPAPQGSKSPKGRTKTGHVIMAESSKKVAPWREAVKAAGEGAGPRLDGPLAVCMVFTVVRPAGHFRQGRNSHLLRESAPIAPATVPDLSKLIRSTEDAITDIGLWADDARVSEYATAAKVFTDTEGCDRLALPSPGVVVACCHLEDHYRRRSWLMSMAADRVWDARRKAAGL